METFRFELKAELLKGEFTKFRRVKTYRRNSIVGKIELRRFQLPHSRIHGPFLCACYLLWDWRYWQPQLINMHYNVLLVDIL